MSVYRLKRKVRVMRRMSLIVTMLALAGLACNMPGDVISTPEQPVDTEQAGDQPITHEDSQPTPSGERPSELSAEQIDLISQAAVQIYAMQRVTDIEPLWSGSGTIVSPDGEIVTNCHVACGAPLIVILMTANPDLPPEARYIAEITHYDEELDLAILRVKTDIEGNPVSLTDLPYLDVGNSDELRLGDPIRIFGYPGVGGRTITFTTGSVSGFESAEIAGQTRRMIIKTDADIASGNSGGTAVDLWGRLIGIPTWVNPDIREGVTLGGIGALRPVNLVEVVRQGGAGAPPVDAASLPPSDDPDPYEPNDTYETAKGPLAPGETITAYISWEDDLDAFYITTTTTQPITVKLANIPPGADYDLYLLDESEVLAYSEESNSTEEAIQFSPPVPGTYWIVVNGYSGSSTTAAYTLTVNYDGGSVGGETTGATIHIVGQAVSGNSGKPLPGGIFGVLLPGVTCGEFFTKSGRDMSLVLVTSETNPKGFFELFGVPTGQTYAAFFIYGSQFACENDWLEIPQNSGDLDLGIIEMSFD